MPKKPRIARISITITSNLLEAADRLAAELDRSRSWVLGEGVRRWNQETWVAAPPELVREPATSSYAARRSGLGDQRLAQLRSDLALGVEARVVAAEEANRIDRELRPGSRGLRLTFFDRYEDYLDWKKHETAGR